MRSPTPSITSTLRGSPVVAAPGKLFLVGEYAVLEGGAAVLCAVSRYAVAQYLPDISPESSLIAESVRRAVMTLGELADALPPGSVLVNTAEFRHRLFKLGLGSSAAAAAAAVGAVFEAAGVDVAADRDRLFRVADEGHRAAQGGVGSGADVAASVYGGTIAFVRPPNDAPVVTALPAPPSLRIVPFWTGRAASTPTMIQGVRAFADSSAVAYRWIIGKMREVSDRFVGAFSAGDARGVVAEADEYGRLLGKLGAAAGVEIVTAPFLEVASAARQLGGTAKPSGAGGGDVGVAFFTDPVAAAEFSRRCPPGISVLDVEVDSHGARRRSPRTVTLG